MDNMNYGRAYDNNINRRLGTKRINDNSDYLRRAQIKKNRRTRQLRMRMMLVAFVICMAASFGIFGMKVHAQGKDDIQLYKYYKSVVVTSNDTLWNYAVNYSKDSNYEKYIAEVQRMNHLDSDKIITGMNLIIPYYSLEFVE